MFFVLSNFRNPKLFICILHPSTLLSQRQNQNHSFTSHFLEFFNSNNAALITVLTVTTETHCYYKHYLLFLNSQPLDVRHLFITTEKHKQIYIRPPAEKRCAVVFRPRGLDLAGVISASASPRYFQFGRYVTVNANQFIRQIITIRFLIIITIIVSKSVRAVATRLKKERRRVSDCLRVICRCCVRITFKLIELK